MKKKTAQRLGKWKGISNFVLGVLVLSVGTLCFAPMDTAVETEGASASIYRNGNAENKGVSLMFNVYWGTDEVRQILEILKNNEAKATFFIGGCWADDNVDCLEAIKENGHELGNHGYFHKDHSKLSQKANEEEIRSCNKFVELAIDYKITLFAPPSGAYGKDMLNACDSLGMKTILWSKDTIDWRDKNASLIYTRATKNIKAGDFVLMHPMQATAHALNDIIKYYRGQGLELVTVSENLQEKG